MAKAETQDMEQLVRWIIMEQFGIDEADIKLSDDFVEDLGCDSLDAVELVMAFEERLKIEISDEDMDDLKTVGQLLTYLQQRVG